MTDPAPRSDDFFAHIGPLRDGLVNLVTQAVTMRERYGHLPDASSPAMAELSEEPSLVGCWGDDPVRQAHSLGTLMIGAAEDHITSVSRLLSERPVPVFSHFVLARAALEACGRAQRMFEAGIGVRRRVERGMTERLYSLAQQGRVPEEVADPARLAARRRLILEEAARQGFSVAPSRKGVPRSIGEARPGSTEVVKQALGDQAENDLGQMLFAYFSAVSHGTAYGLVHSVRPIAAVNQLETQTLGHLTTGSVGANSVLAAMTLAYMEAVERKRQHFGWQHTGWKAGVMRSLTESTRAFPNFD